MNEVKVIVCEKDGIDLENNTENDVVNDLIRCPGVAFPDNTILYKDGSSLVIEDKTTHNKTYLSSSDINLELAFYLALVF